MAADGAVVAGGAAHPLGCHRPRVPERDAMDAVLLVLRTGMQWNVLSGTVICSSRSAHRRFQEWEQAGVFHEIWRQGLLAYDEVVGIDWAWLAADGAMKKAPLGGAKTGPNPTDRAKRGETFASLRGARVPIGLAHDGANRHDSKLLAATLDSVPIQRPKPTRKRPQRLCLDRGYDYASGREIVSARDFEAHIRSPAKRSSPSSASPAGRHAAGSSKSCHSRLNRNRALLIRWPKIDTNHLALLQLARGLIAFKKAHAARLALSQPG